MATGGHGPSYRKYADLHEDVELAACCDLDADKAEKFRQTFGFARSYTDMDAMLDTERPDAVCLIAPVHLTAELAVRVLAKGYPLLLEKPPGLTRAETMRILEAAEAKRVPNMVAFNRRHMPLVTKAREILRSMDAIQHIRLDFTRVGRMDPDFSTTAVHGIDTVRFLAGSDYKHIRFRYQQAAASDPRVVNIFMDCEMANGITAQLNFCPVTGLAAERLTVHAWDQTLLLHLPYWHSMDKSGRLTHLHRNQVRCEIDGAELEGGGEEFGANGFYHENKAFFDAVRAGRRPADDLKSTLQTVEIMECVRERVPEYKNA
jgi:predicted dehydrogenase